MSLPFPRRVQGDYTNTSSRGGDEQELLSSLPPPIDLPTQRPEFKYRNPTESFFSTTTVALKNDDLLEDDDAPPLSPSTLKERERVNSSASSSIMDRGRPKSRSSFFASTPVADRSGEDLTTLVTSPTSTTSRPSSFFGFGRSNSPGPSEFAQVATPSGSGESSGTPASTAAGGGGADRERRSSFYGLNAHIHKSHSGSLSSPAGSRGKLHGSGGDSPAGSGSHSSHSYHEPSSASMASITVPADRPRYHKAPYAASRTASVYGMQSEPDVSYPSAAQRLNHSHLQPGDLASLLSTEKTLELYRTNAKKSNDPETQFEFCTFVMEAVGEMTPPDPLASAATPPVSEEQKKKNDSLVAESVSLLSRLAHRGHVKSQYFLADCYTQGIGMTKGKRDYDKAYPLFLLAGKHGHPDACFRAAQCCEKGWGCQKATSKSVSLYRRGAVLGHQGAMHRLGLAELNGELGLAKRPREGVKWLKRAAELAESVDPPQAGSLHELAMLSEKGIENVIFKDEDYAAELLARASELGYAPSAYKLGECYEYGRMGCPQDSALSIHYYNIAAQREHREACFALTAWYLVGSPGVLPQSDTEAYLWALKAARLGLSKAEYAVGYFTEVGIGTFKDPREALMWFERAAAQGDKRAIERLRLAGVPIPGETSTSARQSRQNLGNPPTPPPEQGYKPPPIAKRIIRNRNSAQPLRQQSHDRFSSFTGLRGHTTPSVSSSSIGVDQNQAWSSQQPPMRRQRSHSQPVPYEPPRAPYMNGSSNRSDGSRSPSYDHSQLHPPPHSTGPPVPGGHFKPIQPGQARMPPRQRTGGDVSPLYASVNGSGEQVGGETREKMLQKRKNGEDKDCIVS